MWKCILRYGQAERSADRLPPITRCPLNEAPGWNPEAYSLVMTFVCLAGCTLVAKVLAESSS